MEHPLRCPSVSTVLLQLSAHPATPPAHVPSRPCCSNEAQLGLLSQLRSGHVLMAALPTRLPSHLATTQLVIGSTLNWRPWQSVRYFVLPRIG